MMSGASQFLGGMFGNSGAPYDAAGKQYQEWANKAQDVQNPFLNMGTNAIPDYQTWLNGMKDPTAFINNLMGSYNESPWAQYEQQQAMRAGTNAASANGLAGSTPMTMQMQQNAQNISSQDMNQWLQNVLGINTQYGAGLNNEIGYGANAANALTRMYGEMGRQMGAAAYGSKAGQNQDFMNMIGGGLSFLF